LLQFLSGNDLLNEPLLTIDNDKGSILHLLLLLFGDLAGGLAHFLEIFTSLVTPEHIFEGSLVKMVIDVMESVLSDVTNDQVRVLPDFTTLVLLHLTDEELDECRLAGTVRSKDGNTRRKRNLEGDIVKLLDR
jgi:hypothetical protein